MNAETFTKLVDEVALLLFDLDGTLVDSTASVKRAWRDFAGRHQVAESDIFAISEGRQGHAVVAELRPDLDALAEDQLLLEYQIADASDVVEVPGANRLLSQLDPARWAIVTSCTRRLAMTRLDAAGLPHPRTLITADETQRSKPDPQGFQLAMERHGMQPSQCLIFEDSAAGIAAANSAGIDVIQVSHAVVAQEHGTIGSIQDWNLYQSASDTARLRTA
ncbi:HAD-IA family hydrolase [Rhodopirellula sp. MGV]|uniref:HAD-IA family hydrolase n=1 Tax=Rhodopirellula sp. MGV TaxID=2023130 RepID=UPI000B96BFE8|nr:HAD-IA family hydrolase [Rhodopirellula sp. MGV]OYP34211.1 hypothetical protein CGZ80_15600 [Rhodopirellula sp. MGV]PNY35045.1 hypothetical protein C2E31_20260 [Rhodopirellula baltica]